MNNPDFTSAYGSMWTMNLKRETPNAAVATLLLQCPRAHPAWNYWMVSLIHLRGVDDLVKPKIVVEGATHEIVVAALDPHFALPALDDGEPSDLHLLTPIDQQVQFRVPHDAAALAILERMGRACCLGEVSPDSDYRRVWTGFVQHLAAHQRGEIRQDG